jgi:hypothetical protein
MSRVVRLRTAVTLAVFASGCATTTLTGKQQQHPVLLSAPHEIGAGNTGKAEPAAATPAAAEVVHPNNELPDPQPLASAEQWEYELRLHAGVFEVVSVKRRVFATPVVTTRHLGRFAFEIWIGRELIERVSFDFPLLGAEDPIGERQALHEAPRFEPGLDASRVILVPNSLRATRAELIDRATGVRQQIPWPPDAPLGPIPAEPEPAAVEARPTDPSLNPQ